MAKRNYLHEWLDTASNDNTRSAYVYAIRALAEFLGAKSPDAAAAKLLGMGRAKANGLAASFRASLLRRRSAATARLRMTCLRQFCAWARSVDIIEWALDYKRVKHTGYRDTRGPDRVTVRRLFAHLAKNKTATGIRDQAIMMLLFDRALRRGEVASLDIEHFDGERLMVAGKGTQRERRPLDLPPRTRQALVRWIRLRRKQDSLVPALFVTQTGARMQGQDIYRMVRETGEAIGVKLRPHGLRHASITAALDGTNGNVRAVREFSRHANIATVMVYDDNRGGGGGKIASMVSRRT